MSLQQMYACSYGSMPLKGEITVKTYEENKSQLLSFIDKTMHQDTVVAFFRRCGQQPFALLLCCVAGKKYNTKVYGVMICSVLSPSRDYDIARAVAAEAARFLIRSIWMNCRCPRSGKRPGTLLVCKKYLFTGLLDFCRLKKGLPRF